MREAQRCGGVVRTSILCFLFSLPAAAQVIETELAGNQLTEYPFFEYVRAFNVNAPVHVAVDPTRFPALVGDTCDIYVVAHKTDWATSPALVDITPGGALTRTFVGTTIQANAFEVAPASSLSASAGAGLGVPYDVVIDRDQDGQLSAGDFIDGMNGEAGLYMVHDTTAMGPFPVTEEIYNIDATVAGLFDIPLSRLGQDLYYPTNVATMGKLPLVVVGHGHGHDFRWYDHIGNHLASYGYVVMSHDNDTGAGPEGAAETTLGHTDALVHLAEDGSVAGGALVGHVDARRIVWIGHSRGAEGVAIAYDRLFDGTWTTTNYGIDDIRLISSMLPTDFNGTAVANPHDANYHLWTAAGDSDVSGFATPGRVQTFPLHERATGYKQSTVVQGAGHAWFHAGGGTTWFTGPDSIGEANTHLIQLGYFLPLIKHYVEGNVPALDFLTRQYESFRPIGVPTLAEIVVTNEYHNGATVGNFVIDDYQTESSLLVSSSGAGVTSDVNNLTEGRLDDNNSDFSWMSSDPFNGATQAGTTGSFGVRTDNSRGAVFDWAGADRFYEWEVPGVASDFREFTYLSFRGAQGTQHPNTLMVLGDLDFTVTLRDSLMATSSIRISAYGGGLEQPYQRSGGWHNEMETIRIRTTDFLHNGAGIDLSSIAAVRFEFGPSHGSNEGRIVLDDLMLTSDVSPFALRILEPTTARPSYAGTSMVGSRVLVRLYGGGGLDMSAANLTISVDGTPLTPAQTPTPPTQVGGETWVIIAPGPKPDGDYDLSVELTSPAELAATEVQSLHYADDESRAFDRVLAIDQTNSMLYDGQTGVSSDAKMQAARAAAKFFVDLSNPNDQIGVISFQRRDQNNDGTIVEPDELAEQKFTMVLAGEGLTDQRPNARNAIQLISPDTDPGFVGPETSPGAGLVEARTMLNAGAMAGHEANIVMLTDGLENHAPYWTDAGAGGPLRPDFAADNIRVDTVGIGGDADDALLQDIAAATGGEYRNLNEGAGSFFLLSRLSDWYKFVDEEVRGEQRFYYAEGFPASVVGSDKRVHVGWFDVEPSLDWMTVAFHANLDHAVNVELFEPGATTPITITPPGSTLREDPKHSVYRVRTPMAGRWAYVVQVYKPYVEFFAVASALTSLTAKVGPTEIVRQPGGDYLAPLRLWIADAESVTGATVTGLVRLPNGVQVPITLADDGLSMDGGANDGIYGNGFNASLPGPHYVQVKAAGTSNDGIPFERYTWTSFLVPGEHKRPVQPGEGLRPPRLWCGCEKDPGVTVSLFAGVTSPRGAFDTIADSGASYGIKVAQHFPAFGGWASLGLYLGRDEFDNPGPGGDFRLTHLSPELEYRPPWDWCASPSFHIGAGAYRDESGATELGYNLGLGLSMCLTDRASLVLRYDYRSVNELKRDYSTVQIGLRWGF